MPWPSRLPAERMLEEGVQCSSRLRVKREHVYARDWSRLLAQIAFRGEVER